MSAFHPILNEAYTRERLADYRRSQVVAAMQAERRQRPFRLRPARITRAVTRRLNPILSWAG